MALAGRYARMFDLQARYYSDDADVPEDGAFTEPPVPVAAKPVAAKPVAAKPVAAKPVAAKPVAAKPVAADPIEDHDEWADYEIEYADYSDVGEAR
jgi:hypothetical protein